jgi:hypothetical protein
VLHYSNICRRTRKNHQLSIGQFIQAPATRQPANPTSRPVWVVDFLLKVSPIVVFDMPPYVRLVLFGMFKVSPPVDGPFGRAHQHDEGRQGKRKSDKLLKQRYRSIDTILCESFLPVHHRWKLFTFQGKLGKCRWVLWERFQVVLELMAPEINQIFSNFL